MGEEKKKKRKRKILGRVKLRTLFLLAITLASNSFAWFIYSTKVSNSITARVKSWNVNFEVGSGGETEEFIEINVDSLYPGMNEYKEELTASNSGETPARIYYEVISANVLGDDLLGTGRTSEEIINGLRNDYPFKIDFSISNTVISALGGKEIISITVSWPYESGNDADDTMWGNRAYDFHKTNPDIASINLVVKITAVQIDE